MSKDKFIKDLQQGKKGEDIVVKHLESKGYKMLASSSYFDSKEIMKAWDFIIMNKDNKQIKIEIKTDYYVSPSFDTGNIMIEFKCRGRKSGISSTESKYWFNYFINLPTDNLYVIKVDELRKYLKENKDIHRTYSGDDNKALCYCIDKHQLKQNIDFVKVFTIENTTGRINPPKSNINHFNKVCTKSNDDSFLYIKNPLDWD